MKTAIIVPCRLESQRFPRKLLYPIKEKALVLWTAERIKAEAPDLPLFFAVDDASLFNLLKDSGYEPILTSPTHQSGTDRITEANSKVGAKFVINVQADEPLIHGEQIHQLETLIETDFDMATLATPFQKTTDFLDPNQVKVVLNKQNKALYFSRSPIPYNRDASGKPDTEWLTKNHTYRHLGVYAYKDTFLKDFGNLIPTFLEQTEKLEQLRALENNYSIAVGVTHKPTIGVDCQEDIEKILAHLG